MIKLQDVTLSYDGHTILSVRELSFVPGRVCAVIGRNGSGKSTLLRTLVGIHRYQGSVTVDGRELSSLGHRARARVVSYLPQMLKSPAMSVETLVSHGRYARLGPLQALGAKDREICAQAMERTDTWHLRERSLRELSGGERQRVYLAMVVAQDATYVLLDEPTAHLDVTHRLEVAHIMRELAASGKSVIVTLHDLPEAFAVSDEVSVINHAIIARKGDAREVAKDSALLMDAMGACVKSLEDTSLVFSYALAHDTTGIRREEVESHGLRVEPSVDGPRP